ncbi:MAG: phage virion morphogenesis protein [Oleiphilus sp.]|nr:MAG: phage virion morphogenesis protein [Oleiphilus sp.]
MTGIALHYNIDIEHPIRGLDALANVDRSALLTDIAELVIEDTLENFENERAPDGTPWIPSQRDGKTLQDKGHLRDSLTYVLAIQESNVEIGSNMDYAAIHQFGGHAGKNHSVKIDARPYLGLNDDLRQEIGNTVLWYHEQALQL